MQEIINYLSELLADTITSVLTSLYHNWLPLGLAILTASLMKVYVNAEKLKESLINRPKVSTLASVAFGAFTPLCACGTMAVVIGLLSTALPWGPVMAFLTSSPLMSPDTFIMIAGILSFKFAIALTIASVAIGLISGGLTHLIEKKTSFLDDQLRFAKSQSSQSCGCGPITTETACDCSTTTSETACCCSSTIPVTEQQLSVPTCECSSPTPVSKPVSSNDKSFTNIIKKYKIKEVGQALIDVGLKQILLYFAIFAGFGYLIQSFVPTSLIMSLFSGESFFSVPLAALIGLPLYVSGEGAIPLMKALMDGGAGDGAMMAFMITGPATSAWVIAGISAFMKKRVIGLYIGFVLASGIIIGYLYQMLIVLGL
ncbi:permease [Lachnospiraceae bacterium MD1]|uniref:Permease n=1 Tax=Variimorphobacter saccharofermentans TaxID=2755051 RepID=A0A839JVJ1_9FIRM|nr:permease [Variimorphobacter saccharofermentans]MBB2181416.1 permease [Variimorphobacter saccharofermentans]